MWVSAAANLYCLVHGVRAGGCVNMTCNPSHWECTTSCAIQQNRGFQIPCRPDQSFDVCLMGLGLTDCSFLIQGARVGLNSRLAGLCVEVRHACNCSTSQLSPRHVLDIAHAYLPSYQTGQVAQRCFSGQLIMHDGLPCALLTNVVWICVFSTACMGLGVSSLPCHSVFIG